MKQEQIEKKQQLLRDQEAQQLINSQPPQKRAKFTKSTNPDDDCLVRDEHEPRRTASDWEKIFKSDSTGTDSKLDTDVTEYRVPQIIYCSRTHSQLFQFVNEIKKTKFNDDNLEVITLGSRKQLCIHPVISKYKSVGRMNDACLNLKDSKKNKTIKKSIMETQRKFNKIKIGSKRKFNAISGMESHSESADNSFHEDTASTDGGCPYLNGDRLGDLSLQITSKIHDIEECHDLGQQMALCPYYGIRKSVHSAHLIAMPYTSLIHEKTRNSLGISVKDSIIIIDEAHNLIKNINQIHSVQINLKTLKAAHGQLSGYKMKYQNRLKHANATKIRTILKVLSSFIEYLSSPYSIRTVPAVPCKSSVDSQEFMEFVVSIDEFVSRDLKIDHINFYDLIEYIERSEIVRKLHGFVDRQYLENMKKKQKELQQTNTSNKRKNGKNTKTSKQRDESKEEETQHTDDVVLGINGNGNQSVAHSPLQSVVDILAAFSNIDCDGKLVVTKYKEKDSVDQNTFKYIMLNPHVHFKQILAECRSLILCGGTMQPMHHFIQQLLPQKSTTKTVATLSCNHVVSPQRVLALTVPSGPCRKTFDFTFKHRMDTAMIADLGGAIVNFSKMTPGGMVVFFPSFQYLKYVLAQWKKGDVYSRLSQRKVKWLCHLVL